MKVVILAGGLGTRLAEETETRPKPMVEIGGRPILWHIMKLYAAQGFREFVVALGYKGDVIKRYFLDYHAIGGSLTVDVGSGEVRHIAGDHDDWVVHLVETGHDTMTGGRLLRLQPLLGDRPFMLTYGDGVADVDLAALVRHHEEHRRIATITAVRPPARFGELHLEDGRVRAFTEKPQVGEGWINGGFMVLEPAVFRFLHHDGTFLESETLAQLAAHEQLAAYAHPGFWQCMDTLREKRLLEALWQGGSAPWKVWP